MNEIIVIGGGIAGVSAAARLSMFATVTVLEQEEHLAYHASGRSAASFIIDYGNETTRVLNECSFIHLKEHANGVLSDRGLMVLSKESDELEFEKAYKSLGLSRISLNEAYRKIPIINKSTVSYAAYREDVYDLDTNKLIENFVKEARKNGCKFVQNARVQKINFKNFKWIVNTQNDEYCSSIIVNAAGAWADNICNLANIKPIGLKPYRRSMARVPVPNSVLINSWPFVSGPKEDWYAKPDAGQLIISPSEEVLVEPHDAWADNETLAEGIERYQEFVTVPVKKITANWAGLRTFSSDRSLVIGPAIDNSSFFFLAGQGGYGFQTAPAASNLLKDLIIGGTSELDKVTLNNLLPNRFF